MWTGKVAQGLFSFLHGKRIPVLARQVSQMERHTQRRCKHRLRGALSHRRSCCWCGRAGLWQGGAGLSWLPARQRSPGGAVALAHEGVRLSSSAYRAELVGVHDPTAPLAQKAVNLQGCCRTVGVGSPHLQRLLSAGLVTARCLHFMALPRQGALLG